jgi:hypothetical protein
MRVFALIAAMLAAAQPPGAAYVGTWTAQLAGTAYATLELTMTGGKLHGRLRLADVRLDKQGEVNALGDNPGSFETLVDLNANESRLAFGVPGSDETDRFELRLTGAASAQLTYLPSAEFLEELKEEGIPPPKPYRLTRQVR